LMQRYLVRTSRVKPLHKPKRTCRRYATVMKSASLKVSDPEVYAITQSEFDRQRDGIQLIASENFTSKAVREALSSYLTHTHKYSEGYPKARYYAGNQFIDKNELLCQERALKLFRLDPEK